MSSLKTFFKDIKNAFEGKPTSRDLAKEERFKYKNRSSDFKNKKIKSWLNKEITFKHLRGLNLIGNLYKNQKITVVFEEDKLIVNQKYSLRYERIFSLETKEIIVRYGFQTFLSIGFLNSNGKKEIFDLSYYEIFGNVKVTYQDIFDYIISVNPNIISSMIEEKEL